MNRFVLPAGLFALLVAVLYIGIERAPQKSVIPSALVGKPAPAFRAAKLTGDGVFEPASLRGRWWVMNVWGTWCPECRHEHETLLGIARSDVVTIVGLNWKDDDQAATAWLAELGDPYDIVAIDHDSRIAIDWGVYGAPETFLIDDRGVVVYRHVGAMTPEVWVQQFLSRLPKPRAEGASGAVG